MANTLDSMDLKQIISLHLDGFSNRKISLTLGIARNTVNNYMRVFKASSHTLRELLACVVGNYQCAENGKWECTVFGNMSAQFL